MSNERRLKMVWTHRVRERSLYAENREQNKSSMQEKSSPGFLRVTIAIYFGTLLLECYQFYS